MTVEIGELPIQIGIFHGHVNVYMAMDNHHVIAVKSTSVAI